MHDLQHAKSSAIAGSFSLWKQQAVKESLGIIAAKKKKVVLIIQAVHSRHCSHHLFVLILWYWVGIVVFCNISFSIV